jgi:MOSC domain-containing protein YiiM
MNGPATPHVVAIHLSTAGGQPLTPVPRVMALLEQGLEGDRHGKRRTTSRQVLLIEQETLEKFGLAPGNVREQVTVCGVTLATLVFGARLEIGTARFEVANLCEPCELMDEVQPGLQENLRGRRGRFVRVIGAGEFAVGDPLRFTP